MYLPRVLLILPLLVGPLLASWKNFCTNGKSASSMDYKTYMAEFGKGPCSPTVIVPGILASVLRVQITDCEAFKSANPDTFSKCGWKQCSGSHSPASEYRIWIPDEVSPMTILSPTEHNKECFAGLIKSIYPETGEFKPLEQPGIKVTAEGLTPQTRKSSKCGVKGIENLIPHIPNPEMTEYMTAVVKRLELMGYRSGLTYQALPYDFRVSSGFDPVSKNLGHTIKKMKELTNKKVVITCHSMGNMKTAFALWNMEQKDKDENIRMYLAIAPPFIGANKPVGYATCGSNEFAFPFHLGIDMATWKTLAGSFSAIFELLPKQTYLSQKDTPWLQKILQRVAYEKGESEDPVFDFLPKITENCYQNFTHSYCRSGIQPFDRFADYKGEKIDLTNLKKFMETYSFSPYTEKMFTLWDKRFETIPNINVPTAIVYSTVVPTEGYFRYQEDPRDTANKNKFCNPKKFTWDNLLGDETVPTVSALTPAIKWALEFQAKEEDAKPIKMIEVCSGYNVKRNPYDSKDSQGVNKMDKIEYQGLPCDCRQGKTERHCTHINMLFNPDLIEFMTNTWNTGDSQPISKMVENMTEQELKEYAENCELFATIDHGQEEAKTERAITE